MTDYSCMRDCGIDVANRFGQCCQLPVLRCFKLDGVTAFKLNPDGKIIHLFTPLKTRFASVPRAHGGGHKLQQLTVALDQEVSRYAQVLDFRKITMMKRIEAIGEELLHMAAAKTIRRQADGMDHQCIDISRLRALILIRLRHIIRLF